MMSESPDNWREIESRIKNRAGWRCERCKAPHSREDGGILPLSVHHLDGNPANWADWNLAALCHRCLLHVQADLHISQLWFETVAPPPEWLRPHLDGFLKFLAPKNEVAPGESREIRAPQGADPNRNRANLLPVRSLSTQI